MKGQSKFTTKTVCALNVKVFIVGRNILKPTIQIDSFKMNNSVRENKTMSIVVTKLNSIWMVEILHV